MRSFADALWPDSSQSKVEPHGRKGPGYFPDFYYDVKSWIWGTLASSQATLHSSLLYAFPVASQHDPTSTGHFRGRGTAKPTSTTIVKHHINRIVRTELIHGAHHSFTAMVSRRAMLPCCVRAVIALAPLASHATISPNDPAVACPSPACDVHDTGVIMPEGFETGRIVFRSFISSIMLS
ncbi:hypothetical protein K431DRAFT_122993 [Polychaeton citri CBS 116435]|uniref:Uncharacterized protein n=1 Tax=Polychaeton citri CBS 116435 TaxID=1314669 RepID=A0A9P4Q393_9PEZI|nr:hypothetical protein K431DRAFT_122993 [Polychaeton citri CBS 116435]